MAKLFMTDPWMALIPAVAFLIAWYSRDDIISAIAACCWSVYAVIETMNKYQITCSGECNIRIDLLLIYPALILITVAGFISIAISTAIDIDKG